MNNADKLIEQLSRQLNTTPGQLRQDAESGDTVFDKTYRSNNRKLG